MDSFNNVLIISGDGRKSGKTTMACRLISRHSEMGVIAVKICPHFHEQHEREPVKIVKGHFEVFRELMPDSEKDSSLMLKAGASDVYYVQCTDSGLKDAWNYITTLIPPDVPVICESGGLANFIKPGLHIIMNGSIQDKKVFFTGIVVRIENINEAAEKILFDKNNWKSNL